MNCNHLDLMKVVVGDWRGYRCDKCGKLFEIPEPLDLTPVVSDEEKE